MMLKNVCKTIALVFAMSACTPNQGNKTTGITFEEPPAPQKVAPPQNWSKLESGLNISWGSSYQRYHKEYIPKVDNKIICNVSGWKNERVNAQAVIWSKDTVKGISINISDLKSEAGLIPSSAISHYFVRNVISDEFLGGCGYKKKKQETAHLVADCLEKVDSFTLRAKSARGVWFNIDIPKNTKQGEYSGKVEVKTSNGKSHHLTLKVKVLNSTLPDPAEWKFHLDLWQNPYAVARVHNVELWSAKHFELMRPLYKMLANAGQKCLTVSLIHKPWGGQTLDPFEAMIKRTLKKDGTWTFDYTIFDKWIKFMSEIGINKQINCYTMIPWGNKLRYFDEAKNDYVTIEARATSKEFADYWIPFLKNFTQELKKRNLYDITSIAMDERPMEDMKAAMNLIKTHAPGLKVTSAANYNPGLSGDVYDLSVESKHILPDEVLADRRNKGQKTTFYVCCSAEYPNNFTYSDPAEGVWQGWYAYAKNLDGFLRWAYNSWVEDPIHDTRFRTWPAGDTFFVYPGSKSSIRFEKLREGIQDFEKLRITIAKLKKSNNSEDKKKLVKIKAILSTFEVPAIKEQGALNMIKAAKKILN